MLNKTLLLSYGAALMTGYAEDYVANLPASHRAIQYFEAPANDPVGRLAGRLRTGEAKLEHEDDRHLLRSLLRDLGISPDSQALVFSKTSFQATKISPGNPRAIYFSDDAAVAYVPGGDGLELAGVDPQQGTVFYALTFSEGGKPVFERRAVCITCHQGPNTFGVPGLYVGSVIPNPLGTPLRGDTAIITDHRTEFQVRWGGWYVNAAHGEQLDRANAVASNPSEPDVLDAKLIGRFDPAGYLVPTSDIVALMTFEHQTQMMNYITRVGWEARIAEHDHKVDEVTRREMDAHIEAMVEYMLFVDEVCLKEPIQGISTFTTTFPRRGPRDRRGRSLRDFDLQKRLFRYPLSYMIYNAAFDALPDSVREKTYRRLYEVLTGSEQSGKFAGISRPDREAIWEIVRDTKPNLPAYWNDSVQR